MQRIPFATQSYETSVAGVSLERVVNLFPEKMAGQGRADVLLRNTHGLVPFSAQISDAPVFAMAVRRTEAFAVVGNELFLIRTDGTHAFCGAWAAGANAYATTIACSDTQVVICAPPRLFLWDGAVLSGINDSSDFRAGSVSFLNSRFIYSELDTGRFRWSEVLDAANFGPLNVATAEMDPDVLLGVVPFNGDLWLFGQRTIEVWNGTGDKDAPFVRQNGAVIEVGARTVRSVSVVDNTLMWLGDDLIVYRANGYRPQRLSTWAEEQILAGATGLENTAGISLSHVGHKQYALILPDIGRTLVYDAAAGLWHERSTSGVRWRGQSAASFGDFQLVGDAFTGRIWRMDFRSFSEAGVIMDRMAVLPPLLADTRRAFMSTLELEIEAGVRDPITVTMSYTDDDGVTWSHPRSLTTGPVAGRRTRLRWTRLGSFRRRNLRFTFTGDGPVVLYGAYADIQAGDH